MSLRLYFLNLMAMIILVVVTVGIGMLTIQAQPVNAAMSQSRDWHRALMMPGDLSAVSR